MFNWLKKPAKSSRKSDDDPSDEMSSGSPPEPTEVTEECIVLKKRGNKFLSEGRYQEAEECYRQSVAVNPDFAEGFVNLGFILSLQQRAEEAKSVLEQALRLDPELEDACYLLGTISQEQGAPDDAIRYFNRALELKPDFDVAYKDLCLAYFDTGQYENAKKTVLKGISVSPQFTDLYLYLGNLLLLEKEREQAIESYRKALVLKPDYAVVYSNMGKAFLELGQVEEAKDNYRKAVQLNPDDVASISCLLFIQSFNPKCTPSQYLFEAEAFGRKVLAKAEPFTAWPARTSGAPSRLHIGFVSGDFNNHPVGFFLENVLSHMDLKQFMFSAYSTQPLEDELTARIKPYFESWNSIAEMDDKSAAQKIHADGVHILIDLSGHTSYNRLPVFAWKPAPVQVSWLGYLASTGVPGIDYLLADPISVPEQHRDNFSEKIWYLPDTINCLTPPVASEKLAIIPSPVVDNGYITFGSFQNIAKINDELLALWSEIFAALPQARLLFHSKQLSSQSAHEKFRRRLTSLGIPPERVDIQGPLPSREDFLATYAKVDIVLDSFPYPGITTTCEALWMGVPTLTLAGDTMLSRQGASLLTCAGLADWVAHTKGEYVSMALKYAADTDRLERLRAGLREQVLAAPLFDAPLFARRLEEALHDIWRQQG